jgi:multicomponent Na+:H+ antiporter subunit G
VDYLWAILTACLLLGGAFFTLTASLGLVRLPDVYTRMHAASKAGTVGSGLILLAASLHSTDMGMSLRALAAVLFFILTAPVAAHLLARAALKAGFPLDKSSVANQYFEES